jgi:hypothetical protein
MDLRSNYAVNRFFTNTNLNELSKVHENQDVFNDKDKKYGKDIFDKLVAILESTGLKISASLGQQSRKNPLDNNLYLGKITAKNEDGREIGFSAHLQKVDDEKYVIDFVSSQSQDHFSKDYQPKQSAANNQMLREVVDQFFKEIQETSFSFSSRTKDFEYMTDENMTTLKYQLTNSPYIQWKEENGLVLPDSPGFSQEEGIVRAHAPEPSETFNSVRNETTLPFRKDLALLLNEHGFKNSFGRKSSL